MKLNNMEPQTPQLIPRTTIDVKNLRSMFESVSTVPIGFANSVFQQLKIVSIPAQNVNAQATIAGVDEVVLTQYVGGPSADDTFWPHNVTGTAITSTSTGAMPTPLVSGKSSRSISNVRTVSACMERPPCNSVSPRS